MIKTLPIFKAIKSNFFHKSFANHTDYTLTPLAKPLIPLRWIKSISCLMYMHTFCTQLLEVGK